MQYFIKGTHKGEEKCPVVMIQDPDLRDVDHDITVGHISHPNKSLLNDPLALDLDIGNGRPGSE